MSATWPVHILECHSALKGREALTLAITWVDPEHMTFREKLDTTATQRVTPFM